MEGNNRICWRCTWLLLLWPALGCLHLLHSTGTLYQLKWPIQAFVHSYRIERGSNIYVLRRLCKTCKVLSRPVLGGWWEFLTGWHGPGFWIRITLDQFPLPTFYFMYFGVERAREWSHFWTFKLNNPKFDPTRDKSWHHGGSCVSKFCLRAQMALLEVPQWSPYVVTHSRAPCSLVKSLLLTSLTNIDGNWSSVLDPHKSAEGVWDD